MKNRENTNGVRHLKRVERDARDRSLIAAVGIDKDDATEQEARRGTRTMSKHVR